MEIVLEALNLQKWSFWCPKTILFNSVCSMSRPCFAFRMGMPRPAPFDSLCLISCVESRGSAFEMSRHLPQEMQFWLVFGILKSCLMWGWTRDLVKWILRFRLLLFIYFNLFEQYKFGFCVSKRNMEFIQITCLLSMQ